MSTLSNRTAIRGRLYRIALAGLVSVALLGTAGVAVAQESEDTSSAEVTTTAVQDPTEPAPPPAEQPAEQSTESVPPAEQPAQQSPESVPPAEQPAQQPLEQDTKAKEPEIVVESGCFEPDEGDNAAGFVDVMVTNKNDTAVTYTVTLKTDPEQVEEIVVEDGKSETASFENVPSGLFDIVVTGDNGTSASSEARLDRCGEITIPVDDELQVFVRCVDGHGVMTIYLFNLGETTKTLTVLVDDLEVGEPVELEDGTYLVYLDEEPTADGRYVIRVTGEGVDTQETVTVACGPPSTTTPSTTTPSTTAPPAPQGGAVPPGGLATTGAAIGGVAVLGVIALAFGAALVFIGRRRRASADESGG